MLPHESKILTTQKAKSKNLHVDSKLRFKIKFISSHIHLPRFTIYIYIYISPELTRMGRPDHTLVSGRSCWTPEATSGHGILGSRGRTARPFCMVSG